MREIVNLSINACSLSLIIISLIQLTEVGTMNIFVHWINENGGKV